MTAAEALAAAFWGVTASRIPIPLWESAGADQYREKAVSDAAAILAALDGFVLVPVALVEAAREAERWFDDNLPGTPLHEMVRAALANEPVGLDERTIAAFDGFVVVPVGLVDAARTVEEHYTGRTPETPLLSGADILALRAALEEAEQPRLNIAPHTCNPGQCPEHREGASDA